MCRGVVTFKVVSVWLTMDAGTPPKVTRVVAGPEDAVGRKFAPLITTGSFPSCRPVFGLTEKIAMRLLRQVYVNFFGAATWMAAVPGLTVTTTSTVSGTDGSARVRAGVRTTI